MKDNLKKYFYKYHQKSFVLPNIFRGNNYDKFEESRNDAYRAYRKDWAEIPNNRIVTDFPMHISFATNNSCNLKCPMCPRSHNYTNIDGKPSININDFKYIVDEGIDNGLKAIRLNKQNEPTLTPNLPEYIAYAKDKGIIDVMINTNAVALNRKMTESLILSGLDKINISFDSYIKEKYEKIRIGAKFENVLNNIKELFHLRKHMKSLTPLIRISKITKSDEKMELNKFVELFKDFCDEIAFSNWANYDAKPEIVEHIGIDKDEIFEIFGVCLQPYQRLEIDAYGDVYCCCMELDEMKLGNIKEASLKELWHGDKINRIRKIISEKNQLSLRACSICYAAMIVNGEEINEDITT